MSHHLGNLRTEGIIERIPNGKYLLIGTAEVDELERRDKEVQELIKTSGKKASKKQALRLEILHSIIASAEKPLSANAIQQRWPEGHYIPSTTSISRLANILVKRGWTTKHEDKTYSYIPPEEREIIKGLMNNIQILQDYATEMERQRDEITDIAVWLITELAKETSH